jgi:hypothetical protein
MQEKKPTNAQLQKRLKNAVLHIDKTKAYRAVMFADRNLKIEIEEDVAIISRLSYSLCFNKVVAGGYSRVYMILANVVDMVKRYDCIKENDKVGKFTSYWKLWDAVREKEAQQGDLGVFTVFSCWFDVLQSTLFLCPEKSDEMFALNSIYVLNTYVHEVLSKPYDKDMTNKELSIEISKLFNQYIAEMGEEQVVLHKETKEEQEQAIADAMAADEVEQNLEEQADENKG